MEFRLARLVVAHRLHRFLVLHDFHRLQDGLHPVTRQEKADDLLVLRDRHRSLLGVPDKRRQLFLSLCNGIGGWHADSYRTQP